MMNIEIVEQDANLIALVTEENEVVVTEVLSPQIVEVITPGVQGPSGAGGARYIHTQSSPSSTWTINHNLGYNPSITLLSTGGVEIEAGIIHSNLNQVLVSFVIPMTGTANLV